MVETNKQFSRHKYRISVISFMTDEETERVEVTGSREAFRVQRKLEAAEKQVVVRNLTLGVIEHRTEGLPEYD